MNIHHVLTVLVSAYASTLACAETRNQNGIDGCWSGTLTINGSSVAFSGHIQNQDGVHSGRFDTPAVASYGKLFESIDVRGSTVTMLGGKGRSRLSIAGELNANTIVGTWRYGPMAGEIQLQRCSLPIPPENRREEVAFSNGDIHLAGTLITPPGAGPFPVVVWTHGSGRIHRANRIYSRWVNLVARDGVASLIYDKRGIGDSSGAEPEATLHDLARDLLAGVAFAKSRPEIDPNRIGVSGLSQGGWIGPLAASLSSDVAFVIAESASGVSASDQDLFVQANRLRKQNRSESEIGKIIALRQQLFRFYRTGEGESKLRSELQSHAAESWYAREGFPPSPFVLDRKKHTFAMSRFELDVVGTWEKVHVPVLAVWGANDRLVPAEKSRTIIAAALGRAGNKDVHLEVFPVGTHTLEVGKSANDPWSRARIIPEWPPLLRNWVKRHVTDNR